MTSGTFHIVPLGQIVVQRETRQRRELEKIDVLADSIRRLGLIHPIVVTRDNLELIAGERRYAACIMLGWTTIPVQYVDELDESTKQAIELEENIKRQDITWRDRVDAVKKYHSLRVSQTPGWSQAETATAIGLSPEHFGELMTVAEEISYGNQLVTEAPKLSTAVGIARRARERRQEAVVGKLHETFEGVILDPDRQAESIITADFNEWIGIAAPDIRFNFIHCDFPYGIGADEFNQGAAPSYGGYADTVETWTRLMTSLEFTTRHLTAPSCHLMFWFSMRKGDQRLYEGTARALERMGWEINPMPLIWMKTDGVGILPDPQRGPRQIYETCLLGARGDRKIVRAKANAYGCPTDGRLHMSSKPEPMLRHFFEMLVDQNTVLLDPTCGGGDALRAAESLGAKYVLGLEINPEFAETARRALNQFRTLRRAREAQR